MSLKWTIVRSRGGSFDWELWDGSQRVACGFKFTKLGARWAIRRAARSYRETGDGYAHHKFEGTL